MKVKSGNPPYLTRKSSPQILLPWFEENKKEAGCDEAGRGCLAGPVFAAAVILPPDFYDPLLNDSKKLSHKQRISVRSTIEKNAVTFAVAEISNIEIDKINILKASILAMHHAIDKLSIKPESLLIDGNRFYPYANIPHHCIVKGDAKYMSIAAASILAKTYRDEYMEKLAISYPNYGWELNKGYPTSIHKKAIAEFGITPLHRKTFKML